MQNTSEDLKKIVEQLQLPGIDMSAMVEARQRDIEALVEANKTAYASIQTLAVKQTELLTQAMQSLQDAARNLGPDITDPGLQAELLHNAYDKAMSDIRVLSEMARDFHADTMAHITQRANEHLREIKKLMPVRH